MSAQMKRCPKCATGFHDTVIFCNLDGSRLTADFLDSNAYLEAPDEEELPQTETSAGESQPVADFFDSKLDVLAPGEDLDPETGEADRYYVPSDPRVAQPRQNSQLLSILVLAGVCAAAIFLFVFIVYQRMTNEAQEQSSNNSSNVALTQQQVPLLPSRPSPSDSASPSPEPSPSPTPIASPAQSPRLALSSSPVSTGGKETRRGPVTIRLTNGTSVEADEVWETREGIWYRHRGVVTLLERDQVKSIEKPTPTPTASATPSISPTP